MASTDRLSGSQIFHECAGERKGGIGRPVRPLSLPSRRTTAQRPVSTAVLQMRGPAHLAAGLLEPPAQRWPSTQRQSPPPTQCCALMRLAGSVGQARAAERRKTSVKPAIVVRLFYPRLLRHEGCRLQRQGLSGREGTDILPAATCTHDFAPGQLLTLLPYPGARPAANNHPRSRC